MREGMRRAATAVAGPVARHPLAWGLAWAIVIGALLGLGSALDWPFGIMGILLTLLLAPSAIATVIVLKSTPRDHLPERVSIFGHFFVRFLTLIVAFFAWSASVVVGAAISTAIQLEAEGREDEVVDTGLTVMLALMPFVAIVLWVAFIMRCAWFLARIRGWRAAPAHTEVPDAMLAARPVGRALVIALANPALLLITGFVASFGVLAGIEVELELY
jgi:hypothetical protein